MQMIRNAEAVARVYIYTHTSNLKKIRIKKQLK